jgi:hypothetical protein
MVMKTTAARTTALFDLGTVILGRLKMSLPKKRVCTDTRKREKRIQVRNQEKGR